MSKERMQVYLEKLRSMTKDIEDKLQNENIDVTEPSKKIELGSLHPITQIIDEVKEIFLGMGYEIADGPEVEKAIYNFDKLTSTSMITLANIEKP